ncbi:hypothetical protein ALC56_11889, partial [Trachymyrmex septentrionalis]
VLKESMIERNEQLSELKNLFSYLEEHRSLKGYEGSKTSRSSALCKNGTSVGESDTTDTAGIACATRPPRASPCRKLLCTDYKVDIGCTSCILYDLCQSADGPGFKVSPQRLLKANFCKHTLRCWQKMFQYTD